VEEGNRLSATLKMASTAFAKTVGFQQNVTQAQKLIFMCTFLVFLVRSDFFFIGAAGSVIVSAT
jgi:ABC-type uncharacterized transport system permease subunit